MITMYVMTLGELNYHDEFMPWENLPFSTLTNILFIVLVLGMPIIMMNMLVSLLGKFRRFPKILEDFPKITEGQSPVFRTFPQINDNFRT